MAFADVKEIFGGVPFYMHCLKGMKHIYIKDSGVVD